MALPTAQQSEARLLERFGIDATLREGHAEGAAARLASLAPFKGFALTDDPLPGPVLDWLVLEAYRLAEDPSPGLVSGSLQGVSLTYSQPGKADKAATLQRGLLTPYLLRGAIRTVPIERG